MRMNFGEVLEIADWGNHPATALISLGISLAGTVNVTPDPKRKNFYEMEDGSTGYYFYVSSVSRTIFLLASWTNAVRPIAQLDVAGTARS